MPPATGAKSPGLGPSKPPTNTRYRCGYPGCNKRYASTDGVRKHARKTHMAWLKSVDENAGSRDRQTESKPSTYCVMEVGMPDDDIVIEAESPALTPCMNGLTMGGVGVSEIPLLSMPETAAVLATAAPRDNNASMAAAAVAASCLVGSTAPPPLAWLMAQNGCCSGGGGCSERGGVTSAAPSAVSPPPGCGLPPHFGVPAPLAAQFASLPAWLQEAAALGAFPPPGMGLPSPLDRLGQPNQFAPDFSALFAVPPPPPSVAPAPPQRDESAAKAAADPLATYLTPPTGSAAASACVSPFELDKKAKSFTSARDSPVLAEPRPALEALPLEPNSLNLSVSCSSLAGMGGLSSLGSIDELASIDDFPLMKESEYAAFVETLLAN